MWGKMISLPYEDHGWWFISRITGNLLHSIHPPPIYFKLPLIVSDALKYCDSPYECGWSPRHIQTELSSEKLKRLTRADETLFSLGNAKFLLSILYSGFSMPIFNTTRHAFGAISELPNHQGNSLDKCFQRTLLAAKTSASFPRTGVIFIGADLSSNEMHAWIIEDGQQPDYQDRSWINYRPLLAITKS